MNASSNAELDCIEVSEYLMVDEASIARDLQERIDKHLKECARCRSIQYLATSLHLEEIVARPDAWARLRDELEQLTPEENAIDDAIDVLVDSENKEIGQAFARSLMIDLEPRLQEWEECFKGVPRAADELVKALEQQPDVREGMPYARGLVRFGITPGMLFEAAEGITLLLNRLIHMARQLPERDPPASDIRALLSAIRDQTVAGRAEVSLGGSGEIPHRSFIGTAARSPRPDFAAETIGRSTANVDTTLVGDTPPVTDVAIQGDDTKAIHLAGQDTTIESLSRRVEHMASSRHWLRLQEKFSAMIRNYFLQHNLGDRDVDELTRDVFDRLLRELCAGGGPEEYGSFHKWLLAAARSALDEYRLSRRESSGVFRSFWRLAGRLRRGCGIQPAANVSAVARVARKHRKLDAELPAWRSACKRTAIEVLDPAELTGQMETLPCIPYAMLVTAVKNSPHCPQEAAEPLLEWMLDVARQRPLFFRGFEVSVDELDAIRLSERTDELDVFQRWGTSCENHQFNRQLQTREES